MDRYEFWLLVHLAHTQRAQGALLESIAAAVGKLSNQNLDPALVAALVESKRHHENLAKALDAQTDSTTPPV